MKSKLFFAVAQIDASQAQKSSDGALILNAFPMRTGDYEYFSFEVGGHRQGFDDFDEVTGRIEAKQVRKILKSFKGLPVTDSHVFIDVGERDGLAAGVILAAGKLKDDMVHTEALIHDPKTVMKITNGTAAELSIGFYSDIRWNENKKDGEPDFFIEDIDLNHVAVVKEGRAGPDARLANHKAKLKKEASKKENQMAKIKIDGTEYEVDDAVATEFARLGTETETLTNSVGAVTKERDVARGQLASAKADLEDAKKEGGAEAKRIAGAHSKFLEDCKAFQHDTSKLAIGEYDENAIKREILENTGKKIDKDASVDYVNAFWDAAIENASKSDAPRRSVLDNISPKQVEHDQSVAQRANAASHASYFDRKSKKKAKEE